MSQSGPPTNLSENACTGVTVEPCSQSTMATLEVLDGVYSSAAESDDEAGPWGRLFPLGEDLMNPEHIFGRGDECDYCFTKSTTLSSKPYFAAYSKLHFKILREQEGSVIYTFIEDKSSNGTFVNGEKIGKNRKQVLNNNDEISLSVKNHKAFVYMDNADKENVKFPEELRQKYTMSRILGRGACGEVRLAFSKGVCERVAIKVVEKNKFSLGSSNKMNLTSQVMSEVKILKSLKHPCIIGIQDVIDTDSTLYIVLELVEGGELFDRITSVGQLDEPTAKLIFYQMVLAIKYLHDQAITHRDLKPENVLLVDAETNETLIKITDFGLSKLVDGSTMLKTFCGTPTYLAPEVLLTRGSGSYTKAIDCWSLGVILYICLGGYPPFSSDYTDMRLSDQIIRGRYSFPKKHWRAISGEAINMIKRLLTVKPEHRITMSEALNHKWLCDEDMQRKANKIMHPQNADMRPPISSKRTSPRKGAMKRSADRDAELEKTCVSRNDYQRPPQDETPPPQVIRRLQ
ncbi:PREDICTED: serine/threonine-protein kinase Chk2-like isoform X2 [Priapulus caudatus]|uniref:Serine/threonine-protein kinase Chk2-like isoform X2 n=1 Tax=Priapulus caudatus TaxID=37621 RepID=A0ABM1E4R5_PRICU|nr:PREDICTED: serine/threonine-protein kinase Chk2-like isoform X2 [Priapulus caudatus]